MISFKHLLESAISSLPINRDQVSFSNTDQYMYLDLQEGNEVVRRVIKAPGVATDVSFDNSENGMVSTTVQDAIDEILLLVRQSAPEIIINTTTGELSYDATSMTLKVNDDTGDLEYESGIYTMEVDDNGDLRYEIS